MLTALAKVARCRSVNVEILEYGMLNTITIQSSCGFDTLDQVVTGNGHYSCFTHIPY
jgi:hypothetical protein